MNSNDAMSQRTTSQAIMVHSEKLEYHNIVERKQSKVALTAAPRHEDLSWNDCSIAATIPAQNASWSAQVVLAGDDQTSLDDSNHNSASQLILSSPEKSMENFANERLASSLCPPPKDDTSIVECTDSQNLDSNYGDLSIASCDNNSLLETLTSASRHDLVEALTKFHQDMNALYDSLLSGDSVQRKSCLGGLEMQGGRGIYGSRDESFQTGVESISSLFNSRQSLSEQVNSRHSTNALEDLDVPQMEENSKMNDQQTNKHSPLPHEIITENRDANHNQRVLPLVGKKADRVREGCHSPVTTGRMPLPANLHDNSMETVQERRTPDVILSNTQTDITTTPFEKGTSFVQHLTFRRIVLILMVVIPALAMGWDCLFDTFQFLTRKVTLDEIVPSVMTKRQTMVEVIPMYNTKTVLDEKLFSSNESAVNKQPPIQPDDLKKNNSEDFLTGVISLLFENPSTRVIDYQEQSFASFLCQTIYSSRGLLSGMAPMLLFLVFVLQRQPTKQEEMEPNSLGSTPDGSPRRSRRAVVNDTQQFLTILQIYLEKGSIEDASTTTFQQMDKMSLRTFLKERSLPLGMTKADMIGRLVVHYRKELMGMRCIDLRKMLKEKGLSTTGKKDELILRLLEDGFFTDSRPKQRICYSSDSIKLDLTNYVNLRTVDLQKLLKDRQCSCYFSKHDMLLRVIHFYKQELYGLSYGKLQKLLKAKDLIQSGQHEELVSRLVKVGL